MDAKEEILKLISRAAIVTGASGLTLSESTLLMELFARPSDVPVSELDKFGELSNADTITLNLDLKQAQSPPKV